MIIKKAIKYITSPRKLLIRLGKNSFLKNMSDEKYIKLIFRDKMGYDIDLENPKTFNEKLQWLKLYNRNPLYTTLADKYEVRKYVAKIAGEEYLIPLYGVWDSFDEIDFDALPDTFVLKCNHDSGGLSICKGKKNFDFNSAEKKIKKSLASNYFWSGREWPYKNIKPRIIAEKYMVDKPGDFLFDYKFYCMNGKAKFLYVSKGFENHATTILSFYDLDDMKRLPFGRNDIASFDVDPEKPENFNEMIELANRFAQEINSPFLRVDLYSINGKIYFSEFTFSPCSGMMPFEPQGWDLKIGDMLELPKE